MAIRAHKKTLLLVLSLISTMASHAYAETSSLFAASSRAGNQVHEARPALTATGASNVSKEVRSAARIQELSPDELVAKIGVLAGNERPESSEPTRSVSLPFKPQTVETTVRQFRREGLPLAHLWRSESSSVTLGLSPKGKPGLWFVKKLP